MSSSSSSADTCPCMSAHQFRGTWGELVADVASRHVKGERVPYSSIALTLEQELKEDLSWIAKDADDWEDSTLLKLAAVTSLTFEGGKQIRLLESNPLMFWKFTYKMHGLNTIKDAGRALYMHDLKNKIKKVQSTVDRHIDEHLKDPAFLWDYDPPLDINESHKGRDVGKALKRLLSLCDYKKDLTSDLEIGYAEFYFNIIFVGKLKEHLDEQMKNASECTLQHMDAKHTKTLVTSTCMGGFDPFSITSISLSSLFLSSPLPPLPPGTSPNDRQFWNKLFAEEKEVVEENKEEDQETTDGTRRKGRGRSKSRTKATGERSKSRGRSKSRATEEEVEGGGGNRRSTSRRRSKSNTTEDTAGNIRVRSRARSKSRTAGEDASPAEGERRGRSRSRPKESTTTRSKNWQTISRELGRTKARQTQRPTSRNNINSNNNINIDIIDISSNSTPTLSDSSESDEGDDGRARGGSNNNNNNQTSTNNRRRSRSRPRVIEVRDIQQSEDIQITTNISTTNIPTTNVQTTSIPNMENPHNIPGPPDIILNLNEDDEEMLDLNQDDMEDDVVDQNPKEGN